MKSVIVKMEPCVNEILSTITGISQSSDDKPLPEGSGYTFHRWIDNGLAEYYISSSDEVFAVAIDEMIAKGLTITFPPEPVGVEEEVSIA